MNIDILMYQLTNNVIKVVEFQYDQSCGIDSKLAIYSGCKINVDILNVSITSNKQCVIMHIGISKLWNRQ